MWQPEQPSSQTVASRGLRHRRLRLPAVHLEVRQERPALLAPLGDRAALLEQRAGRTDLDALAAARAGRRLAPRRAHVGHDPLVDARAHDAPGVGALDLAADPHAADAHDAAVVVDREERMDGVDADRRVDDRQLEVVDLQVLGEVLELAVVVGDADRADVVALEEQHLGDRPAVLDELLGGRRDLHALGDGGRAGRGELGRAGDLDDAQPARARVGQPVEVAHRRDVDAVLGGDREDRLAVVPGHVGAVDPERVDGHAEHRLRLDRADPGGADPVDDVGEVLVAEVAQGAEDRVRGALAEAAQARPLDHVGEPLHLGEVVHRRLAAGDPVEQHPQLRGADPAGNALAARLLAQKSMKNLATSTMQDVSSMTIIPPEPMNEPTSISDS